MLPFLCLSLVFGGNNNSGQGYDKYQCTVLSTHARGYGFECRGKYGCSVFLSCPTKHSTPIYSAVIKSGGKGCQKCLDPSGNTNTFYWIFFLLLRPQMPPSHGSIGSTSSFGVNAPGSHIVRPAHLVQQRRRFLRSRLPQTSADPQQ